MSAKTRQIADEMYGDAYLMMMILADENPRVFMRMVKLVKQHRADQGKREAMPVHKWAPHTRPDGTVYGACSHRYDGVVCARPGTAAVHQVEVPA